jgi:hypothetical protein
LVKGIANALQGMDPRCWLQSIVHSLLGASITLTVLFLVIFCIGYSCLQWQLKPYKTSEAMITLGLLHLKNEKVWIFGLYRGTLPVWSGVWPCEKTPRNWDKDLRTRRPDKQQCSSFPRWLHVLEL